MKYKDIPPGSIIIDDSGTGWYVYRDFADGMLKHIPIRTTQVNVGASLESDSQIGKSQRVVDVISILRRVMKDENR